jgi:perosamine synthetase
LKEHTKLKIFTGSTPNTTEKDLLLAKGILSGAINTKGARESLKEFFQNTWEEDIFLFNRGREAVYFLLKNLGLKKDDEIILQAFTCIATVEPILWSKCKPVFVDIQKNRFNIDLEKLRSSITPRTRVVLIQHTFGEMVNMKKVREIVESFNNERDNEEKIFLIEDCAHLFSLTDDRIGKYSDAFFFSFAQDKAISSTQGAMLVVKNNNFFSSNLKQEYEELDELNQREATYNARYILLWEKIKRFYYILEIPLIRFSLGKLLILLFRFLGLIKKQAGVNIEKGCNIKKMSEVQAQLLLRQLEDWEVFNQHRQDIVTIYEDKLKEEYRTSYKKGDTLLRYPVLSEKKNLIRKILREEKVIVGNWYSSPVYPLAWENLSSVGYVKGSCPNVETACKDILNLPTGIEVSKEQAEAITDILNSV